MNVSFPMKLAWQADCSFLFLRWKRSTWISKVSFGFRFNSVPQSKCTSRDFSEDQPGSRFSWCDNGNFDRKWSSRSNTWGSSITVRDLPLLSACWSTCDAPRKKEMETKYPGKCWEKQRTRPICFVSRNQKHPGRHFYCFLETKHTKNPGLFPMFPFETWDRPRRAGIRRLTGREEKQSSAN